MAIKRGRNGSKSLNTEFSASAGKVSGESTVAAVPDATENEGRIMYISNGAAGSPCLAYSNGTDWLRITLGAAIAAA